MNSLVLLPDRFVLTGFALLGLCVGSFANVLILRLPGGKTISGRSACPHCNRTLLWRDLVPLVSFLVLQGKCRNCGGRISWQYPLVEAAMGALFLIAIRHVDLSIVDGLFVAFSLAILLIIGVIDARTQTIPDVLNGALIVFALAHAMFIKNVDPGGALLAGGFFAAQWILSRGKFLGSGDVLLGIGIGLLLGTWQMTLLGIGMSYVIGAAAVSVLLLTGCIKGHLVAFGPFLVMGTIVTLVWGEKMLEILGYK